MLVYAFQIRNVPEIWQITKTISLFLHSEAVDTPKLTWSVINRKYYENHQNILAVITLVLILPASSAEVERGFSQLKILKSDIRSTLSEEHLNDLLAVKLLSADIQNFDPLPAIELWSTSSVRTTCPLLKDRASQRESSTVVVNVAADNTVVSTASSVAVPVASPVAGTAAESDPNAALWYLIQKQHPQLQWHTPQKRAHYLIQRMHCLQLSYCQ